MDQYFFAGINMESAKIVRSIIINSLESFGLEPSNVSCQSFLYGQDVTQSFGDNWPMYFLGVIEESVPKTRLDQAHHEENVHISRIISEDPSSVSSYKSVEYLSAALLIEQLYKRLGNILHNIDAMKESITRLAMNTWVYRLFGKNTLDRFPIPIIIFGNRTEDTISRDHIEGKHLDPCRLVCDSQILVLEAFETDEEMRMKIQRFLRKFIFPYNILQELEPLPEIDFPILSEPAR